MYNTNSSKEDKRKQTNPRMLRILPKSPLKVFTELYKNVPITLEETILNDLKIYIASFTIEGQEYKGIHSSQIQAKQKACESFLQKMLVKKMSGESEIKRECSTDIEMEEVENNCTSKVPQLDDFPWSHYNSLAMHNLITQWELHRISNIKEKINKSSLKSLGLKKLPNHPEQYNPVELLHLLKPNITFSEIMAHPNYPSCFEVSCEIKGKKFMGKGKSKKSAKNECAIAAIKFYWNFNFHTIKK